MLSQTVTWPLAAGAFLVGMFVYYRKVVVRPVALHAKEGGKLEHFLRRHLEILKDKYWPTFWCFESRLQTVLASMTRRMIPYIYYRREVPYHSKHVKSSESIPFRRKAPVRTFPIYRDRLKNGP